MVGPWHASSRWRVLYVAATPDGQVAQLRAEITELRSELNELEPEHRKLSGAQQAAQAAQEQAEKAQDAALAHLKQLQRQGADEASIKAAEEDYARATTLLNRRQAANRDITIRTEQVDERISAIHKSMTAIHKSMTAIHATIASIASIAAKEAAIAKEAAKEAAAAKGALLVPLLCLATALPHGS